tara:strand:- start:240 stop:785 length:546 start_codon:yes stop_codon:yes gene_type:complete
MKTESGQSQESTDGETSLETSDPISGPVIESSNPIEKGDDKESRLTDDDIDEAASELGLTKLRAATVRKLKDVGIAAEQAGAIRVALGRVLVSDDRLDELLDVAMSVAKSSPDDETKIKAASAGASLANQISRNAELIYKMASNQMLEKPQEKRKFQGMIPDHVIVPVQNNVEVNLTEKDS